MAVRGTPSKTTRASRRTCSKRPTRRSRRSRTRILRGLREELGDVLLQVAFHARLAEELPVAQRWTIDDVATGLVDKLVRRHPHVFDGVVARDGRGVRANWESIKAAERGDASVSPTSAGCAGPHPGGDFAAQGGGRRHADRDCRLAGCVRRAFERSPTWSLPVSCCGLRWPRCECPTSMPRGRSAPGPVGSAISTWVPRATPRARYAPQLVAMSCCTAP